MAPPPRATPIVTNDREAGTRTRDVDYTGFDGKTRSVDSVATKTDDGLTRSTTVTNAQGQTATRDLTVVARQGNRHTTTRSADYTTFDGREGSMSDVIQRTDDGYSRDTVAHPAERRDAYSHRRCVLRPGRRQVRQAGRSRQAAVTTTRGLMETGYWREPPRLRELRCLKKHRLQSRRRPKRTPLFFPVGSAAAARTFS